jgi:tricarballylate dehydrogenase
MRVVFDGVDDLVELMPDLTEAERANADFGSYTAQQYFDDMARVTQYRADPDLVDLLVRNSFPTLVWMRHQGVRFQPSYGRQAFEVDGRFRFWGGLAVEARGGGEGLVELEHKACQRAGVELVYEAAARSLVTDDHGRVTGVEVRHGGRTHRVDCRAVVLAAGGFQANAEWRARYLGTNWDLAKVRGTKFNTGAGIHMALDVGAMPFGHWSGCHAVGWDLNAPPFGDLAVGDGFQKHSYPLGIMVNARGERFVDEGADFRNYTYAKYGAVILAQPDMFAWQVFDAKVSAMLRDEYRIREVTKVKAATLEELVAQLEGVDPQRCLETIHAFNAAVEVDVPFNPAVKDGRGTPGIPVPKTNWANRLDTPPYEAYAVTCGITFTFGGLRITTNGEVVDTAEQPIGGLFACGELVGGLFYHNYPGGTGLVAGSVFGKIAGTSAAAFAG